VALNGLAQIPAPESPVSVSFVVNAPVPCLACRTESGKECGQCQGMGWVTAPEEPSAAVEHEHGTSLYSDSCDGRVFAYAADNENRRFLRPKDDHISLEPDG
jgi:hypothetical protein